jgi:putative hemolysin
MDYFSPTVDHGAAALGALLEVDPTEHPRDADPEDHEPEHGTDSGDEILVVHRSTYRMVANRSFGVVSRSNSPRHVAPSP